jgi:RNA polymerase sigma-70 factor (ECF subfamily)
VALAQPDRRLLERACRGDERAFEQLVHVYRAPLLAYVRRMVGDSGLAEDLVQDIFLRVYRQLQGFRGRCTFTTWLFQIAKNRVLDELRAQARRPTMASELTDSMAAREHPPERDGEIDETVGAIWKAVSDLDVDLRMPLLLRDVGGLSYREIAATLDIELSTVKWRIYSARETIQSSHADRQLSPHFERVRPRQAPKTTLTPTPSAS